MKAEAEALADVTAETLRRRFSSSELAQGLSLVQCGSLIANEFYRLSFERQLELRLLSQDKQKARFDWQRVATGGDARRMAAGSDQLLKLDWNFRPAIAKC